MSDRPFDSDALADALCAAHPDVEPFEVDADIVAGWVAAAGADPDDDLLVAQALSAWEQRRG